MTSLQRKREIERITWETVLSTEKGFFMFFDKNEMFDVLTDAQIGRLTRAINTVKKKRAMSEKYEDPDFSDDPILFMIYKQYKATWDDEEKNYFKSHKGLTQNKELVQKALEDAGLIEIENYNFDEDIEDIKKAPSDAEETGADKIIKITKDIYKEYMSEKEKNDEILNDTFSDTPDDDMPFCGI